MLDSLFWSDRNKSLFVLHALTAEREREVIEALRRRSILALVEMARFRSQFARPAFTLLGRVAGMSEEEIQEAWQAEERDKTLARILSRIGKAGG